MLASRLRTAAVCVLVLICQVFTSSTVFAQTYDTYTVVIEDNSFDTTRLILRLDDRVRWENRDNHDHYLLSDRSPYLIQPGRVLTLWRDEFAQVHYSLRNYPDQVVRVDWGYFMFLPELSFPHAPPWCDDAYPDMCIPSPPPDLNCVDIEFREFAVLPPDPHEFDIDGDGVGCESG